MLTSQLGSESHHWSSTLKNDYMLLNSPFRENDWEVGARSLLQKEAEHNKTFNIFPLGLRAPNPVRRFVFAEGCDNVTFTAQKGPVSASLGIGLGSRGASKVLRILWLFLGLKKIFIEKHLFCSSKQGE